jgi:hypothetical protein
MLIYAPTLTVVSREVMRKTYCVSFLRIRGIGSATKESLFAGTVEEENKVLSLFVVPSSDTVTPVNTVHLLVFAL